MARLCIILLNTSGGFNRTSDFDVPPISGGMCSRATPIFSKCAAALPDSTTNFSRAVSVMKYFPMLHAKLNNAGECAMTKALNGSGWNCAAASCDATALMTLAVHIVIPSFPVSMMKMDA
eukprot:30947-Pelagococcus_subviridis.AAC.14